MYDSNTERVERINMRRHTKLKSLRLEEMTNKFDTFDFQLDHNGPHLSGDTLKGHLLLKLKKDVSFARIVVHLYGGGQLEIAASDNAQPNGSPAGTHRASETYLRRSQVLQDRANLAKGRLYRLPFELRLPDQLPSSFGSVVSYSLTALADRAEPGKSSSLSLPITVIGSLDLNKQPGGESGGHLWQPVEAWGHWQQLQQPNKAAASNAEQRTRQDGLGLATVRLLLDKRGFAIGESISLGVELRNSTKLRLDSVRACLTQKVDLRVDAESGGPVVRREQRLAVQTIRLQERLKPGGSLLEDGVQLAVPWMATAPAPGSCQLLRISHWIQIVCSVTSELQPVASFEPAVQTLLTGQNFDKPEQAMVLLEEPIVIGTKQLLVADGAAPSQGRTARQPPPLPPPRPSASPPPRPESNPTAALAGGPSTGTAPSAPPSYEESLLQRLREEDADGIFA